MSDFIIPLPVGAYGIENGFIHHTRSGKDGNEVMVGIFGGDHFIGDFLLGKWVKDSDALFQGNGGAGDYIRISSSPANHFEMIGGSDAGGTIRGQWVRSKSKLFFHGDATELEFEFEVPTTVTASRFTAIKLVLCPTISSGRPDLEKDFLSLELQNYNNGTYRYQFNKSINGTVTDITGDSWVTTTNRNVVFKLKFDVETGHTHFYVDDGETGTFTEYDGTNDSPFTLGLAFTECYVYLEHRSDDAVERTVHSDYITVSYPSIDVKYRLADADLNKGMVKVYETFDSWTETDWVQLYGKRHKFYGAVVIQNGLVRVRVAMRETTCGLRTYYWNGSAWVEPFDRVNWVLSTDSEYIMAVSKVSIKSISEDKVVLLIRLEDDALADEDYYTDIELTLRRGEYTYQIEYKEVYPISDVEIQFYHNSPRRRWGWVGDAESSGIGDDDLNLTGATSTPLHNILLHWDDAGAVNAFGFIISNKKPTAQALNFYADAGGYIHIRSLAHDELGTAKIFYGIVPFLDIAKTFIEAESGTLGGGVDTVDLGDDSGTSVRLNAQNERLSWDLSGVDELPLGRYLLIARIKDTNQVANDVDLFVYNSTGSYHMAEINNRRTFTATGSWVYYTLIFDMTEEDEGDTIFAAVEKVTATTNNIYIDYLHAIPLSNGLYWPLDIAYNRMRPHVPRKMAFRI